MIKKILICITPIFIGLSACVSKQKPELIVSGEKAQWETKAQIRDLAKDKSHNISMDIFAVKNEKMRIEATAFAGFQVASFLLTKEKVACAVYTQKKYFVGRPSDEALRPLINLQIHPAVINQIAFDQVITGKGWRCDQSQDGLPLQCRLENHGIEVRWTERKGSAKKVILRGPNFEMDWFFYSTKTEVQFKPALFELQPPPGFKIVQLN